MFTEVDSADVTSAVASERSRFEACKGGLVKPRGPTVGCGASDAGWCRLEMRYDIIYRNILYYYIQI